MENRKPQCFVTARISLQERERLVIVARDLDIPYCRILRQLVRYIMENNIGWLELFESTNDLALKDRADVTIRTKLPQETYIAFTQFADERGSTTSVILRRLVLLYIANKIDWRTIWLVHKNIEKQFEQLY